MSRYTMGPRVAPRVRRGRGSLHVFERNLLVYKNSWVVLLSGVFEPLFYLFAVRVGIGGLVGGLQGPNGEAISYAAFVAPALLASSAMNGAMFESTMNIFFKLRYAKL
ncbi:MAG TPA: ABC transporter, partial [Actinomycetota bacterium]|nr:ABC transporter [Actinomycetota bacterium]